MLDVHFCRSFYYLTYINGMPLRVGYYNFVKNSSKIQSGKLDPKIILKFIDDVKKLLVQKFFRVKKS